MSNTRDTKIIVTMSPSAINRSINFLDTERAKFGTQVDILNRYFDFKDDGIFAFKSGIDTRAKISGGMNQIGQRAENELARGYRLVVNKDKTKTISSAQLSHGLKYAGIDTQLAAFATLLFLQNSEANLTFHDFVFDITGKMIITTSSEQPIEPETTNFIEVIYTKNNQPILLVGVKKTNGVVQDFERTAAQPTSIVCNETELFQIQKNNNDPNNPFTLIPYKNEISISVNKNNLDEEDLISIKRIIELAGSDGSIRLDGDLTNIKDTKKLINLLNKILKNHDNFDKTMLSTAASKLISDIESQTSAALQSEIISTQNEVDIRNKGSREQDEACSGNRATFIEETIDKEEIIKKFDKTEFADQIVSSSSFKELKEALIPKKIHTPNLFKRNLGPILGFLAIGLVTAAVITACVLIPPVGAAIATVAVGAAAAIGIGVPAATATAVAGVGILGGLAAIGLTIGLGIKAIVSKIASRIKVEDITFSEKDTTRFEGLNTPARLRRSMDVENVPQTPKHPSTSGLVIDSDDENTASTSSNKERPRPPENPEVIDLMDKKNHKRS